MAVTVNMPQLGESVTEGTIARWLKRPGDAVAKYESIVEVASDKVNAEIPAPVDGTFGKIIAAEGAVVSVGQPICTIESVAGGAAQAPAGGQGPSEAAKPAPASAAAGPAAAPAPVAPAPAAQSSPAAPVPTPVAAARPSAVEQPEAERTAVAARASAPPQTTVAPSPAAPAEPNGAATEQGRYHVTPAVRMLVREHEVDLDDVTGSGIGGRITKKDVLEYVQRRDAEGRGVAPSQGQAAPAQPGAPDPMAAPSAPAGLDEVGEGDRLLPMTSVRRAIADHMVRSRHTSPHAWLMVEVDMSRVSRVRAARKAEFRERYGVSLTYLPFVARAVVEALRRRPTLNSQWSEEGVVLKRDINLGIAVALEENLVVPVLGHADRLSIAGLAEAMADLGERARANRLRLDEIQGGTFTLNNTGALGAVMTQAIINQPQAAILTMDAVVKRPVVVDDMIAIRPIMNLGLSFDHRLNDGLQAARFLQDVKEQLEGLDEGATLL